MGLDEKDGVGEELKDTLAVFEGLAPCEREAVGEKDTVELADSVVDGVNEAVPVPEPVGDDVDVGVGVDIEVTLPLNEILAVFEGLAPCVREAVGEKEIVELADSVVDGVNDGVPVPELREDVAQAVDIGVTPLVIVGVGETVAERDTVVEGLDPREGVLEGVVVGLDVGVAVSV